MDSKYKQELLEEYKEAAMKLLMAEYAEADGARLLHQFEETEKNGQLPNVPADLDAKCRKLIHNSFAKQARETRCVGFLKGLGRVAVYAFVILGLTTSMVLSVDAIRVPVLNFILTQSEKYSVVIFDDEGQSADPTINPVRARIENWVPDDYSLVFEEYGKDETFLLFQNTAGQIISLNVTCSDGKYLVDTEESEQNKVTINNCPAIFIDKNGYRLIWTNEEQGLAYDFFANGLALDSFWKLAHQISSCEIN